MVKKFTTSKKERMEKMLKAGKSVYSIAKELGLTPTTARYHARKMQKLAPVKTTKGVDKPVTIDQLKALIRQKLVEETAKRDLSIKKIAALESLL